MALILSCQSLEKSFGSGSLFTALSLGISDGERLGLIGANGSGKSTLLKLLAGQEKPDAGAIAPRRGAAVCCVAQEDVLPAGATVRAVLDSAIGGLSLESHERQARIGAAVARVGFTDVDANVADLSGGWCKRLAIAAALVRKPDLLLLDEPTNHLDLEGILWLERLLTGAPFAYVVVTHDRYFLQNVANRIIELGRQYEDGCLSVQGNYSDFLVEKARYLEAQVGRQDALETRMKREIEWLRRGPQARTTKAKYRIEEAGRMAEQLGDLRFRNSQGARIDVEFDATRRKTRELLVARSISKGYGGPSLFRDLSLTLSPGVRLGLIGANGSGKTTLLKLLAGELAPDTGTLVRAEGLRLTFFDQDREQLDRAVSLRVALAGDRDTVLFRDRYFHVSAWAQRFLFRSEQLDMPVGALSGGEQARVLIARLMTQPADVLILDEPTNDLDIPSLEVLEESLTEFPGAIVLVTHDRYILDTVSTEMLALEGGGAFHVYADYAQWEAGRRQPDAPPTPQVAQAPRRPPASGRLTTAEQRELAQMEARIEAAEAARAALMGRLEDPGLAAHHVSLRDVCDRIEEAGRRLDALYARWQELEEKRG